MTRCIPLWLSLALSTLACATIDVSVDYDAQTDFSGYRTYGLLPDPPATGNYRADNPLLQQRIRGAIGDRLELQGFASAPDPQIQIGYHASISQKLDVRTVNASYGYGHWRHPGGIPTTEVREYEEGALVIDVVDARRNTLVWRGVGRLRLRGAPTPEQTSQRVREVVAEILGRFPPGAAN